MSIKYKFMRFFKTPAQVLFTKLKDTTISENESIILYGAGEIGRDFLELADNQINFRLIIDRNAEAFPYEVQGVPVRGKEALKEIKSGVAIVASEKFITSIVEDIKEHNPALQIISLT